MMDLHFIPMQMCHFLFYFFYIFLFIHNKHITRALGVSRNHERDVQQKALRLRLALLQTCRHGAARPSRLQASHQETNGPGHCQSEIRKQRVQVRSTATISSSFSL